MTNITKHIIVKSDKAKIRLQELRERKAMEENLYTPNCIRTFTGRYVNVTKPTEDMIDIEDIAHSLSNQMRFGGHLSVPYTVAQHCVLCTHVTEGDKLDALMHDASEAYLLDIPSPIKKHLSDYKSIEKNLMYTIAAKYGFRFPLSKEVKSADKELLELEWESLMLKKMEFPDIIWSQDLAKSNFLAAFNKYRNYETIKI